MYKSLVFDFDFTLGDSAAGIAASINYALGRLGYPEKEMEAFSGKEHVLYVDDSMVDATTAENAKIDFAAVLTGATTAAELAGEKEANGQNGCLSVPFLRPCYGLLLCQLNGVVQAGENIHMHLFIGGNSAQIITYVHIFNPGGLVHIFFDCGLFPLYCLAENDSETGF